MTAAANIYAKFLYNAFNGDVDLSSDTLKIALLGSGYTPNFSTDSHWADIDSFEITGTGYTAGGVTLTDVSLSLTPANSWGVSWAADQAYAYGAVVIPDTPNGFLYRCVSAGVSGGSSPSFPTVVGQTVTDGSTEWACMGEDILVLTSDTPEWLSATFTASYAVIYDAQTGVASTEPLIVCQTFTSPQSPDDQTYDVIPDPNLGWMYWSPPS